MLAFAQSHALRVADARDSAALSEQDVRALITVCLAMQTAAGPEFSCSVANARQKMLNVIRLVFLPLTVCVTNEFVYLLTTLGVASCRTLRHAGVFAQLHRKHEECLKLWA